MRRLLYPISVFMLVVSVTTGVQYARAQEAKQPEYDDPFVRGLKRLETFEGFQRRATGQAQPTSVTEDGETGIRQTVLPGFGQAFDIPRYRLDGILVSEAPELPVIHVNTAGLQTANEVLFFDPNSKRWVYRPGDNETQKDILAKFRLHRLDLADMNGVSKAESLVGRDELYVSPVDNGTLIHNICPGDTLSKLSRTYKIPVSELKKRNKIAPNGWLYIGQTLSIRDRTIMEDMKVNAVSFDAANKGRNEKLGKARKPYVRIFRFDNLEDALRETREFYADYRHYLDSDMVLRQEVDKSGGASYHLDIGPMQSQNHAEAYCVLLKSDGLMCDAVKRVPGNERQNTFDSTAIVRVSPIVFYEGDVNEKNIKIEETKTVTYNLSEGQVLGASEGTVVKITHKEIIVTDAQDHLLTLPIDYLPEVDQEELAARAQAQRQAQAAAVAGAAGQIAAGVEVPTLENPAIVDRLVDNEAKRRKGSTEGVPR